MTEQTTGLISSAPILSPQLEAPAPAVAASPALPGDGAPAAASPAVAAPAKAEMPAGLDAAFWDTEKGSIKFDTLNTEIAALRTAKAEWDNARSVVPEAPDKYEFKVPEGFALPEGMQLNTDDPRLPEVRKMAHEAGLSQKQFEALVKMDVAAKVMESKALTEAIAKEQEKLGPDKGKARVEAVVRGLSAAVGEADAKHLIPMLVSAAQVQAFERLLSRAVNQGQTTAGYQPGGQPANAKMSDEEWNKLSPTEKFTKSREMAALRKTA